MITFVWGSSEDVSEDEWIEAADWYGRRLLGGLADRITLFLELSDHIRGRTGQLGWAKHPTRERPSKFTMQIEVGGCGRRRQLYTFGHEMVHLKQVVVGELGIVNRQMVWRSSHPIGCACDGLCRWRDEPWELEAYSLERPLYREYVSRHS